MVSRKKKRGGVGLLVREHLVENVIQVERINSRMRIKVVMEKKVGIIFSVYAPQVGRPKAQKESFLGTLERVTTVA